MAEKIQMIALSPTMESGTIVKWIKKVGDTVKSGDVICEVETDKATMEYEAMNEGTLLAIVVGEGESAEIGQTIAYIGEKGEDIGELVKSELVKSQHVKSEHVKSKPDNEKPDSSLKKPEKVVVEAPAETLKYVSARVKSSPLARKIARLKGIDISTVKGTGPEGRVVKRDVESISAKKPADSSPVNSLIGERVPLSGMRKIIAKRLSESKFTKPHYYLKLDVEMERLLEARKRLNESIDFKVSLNAFLMKFVAETLKRNPKVNSGWFGDYIEYFATIDLGIAVALEDGLVTPVVKNCEGRGIIDIDKELKVLIDKARNGKLNKEEYTGATFTITNLGSFGIEEFTAIINPPGSAILAVGSIVEKPFPAGMEGSVKFRKVAKLTLSCDHRVIDGAVGARFLKDLKDFIENPIRILY